MEDPSSGAERRLSAVGDALRTRWWLAAAGAALLAFQFAVLVPVPATPVLSPDNALFQYVGYSWVEGHPPYRAVWDLKPPAIYELTALFAVVSGPDPVRHHWLTVAVTNLALTGSVLLVAALTHSLAGRWWPALLAGFSMLASPAVLVYAAAGAFPEYYFVLLGLLSLYWLDAERYALAGTAATLAAGFYHLAVVFPAVVLAATWRRQRSALARVVGAMAATTAAVLLPVVLSGAAVPMLNQVLGGMLLSGGSTPVANAAALLSDLHRFEIFDLEVSGRFTAVVLVGGLCGAASALVRDRSTWPYAVPSFWFLFCVLVVDYDSYLDLLPLVAFAALGVGLYAGTTRSRRSDLLLAGLAVVLLASAVDGLAVFAQLPPHATGDPAGIQALYFDGSPPPGCHLRLSGPEVEYIERTGASRGAGSCRTEFLLDELLWGG